MHGIGRHNRNRPRPNNLRSPIGMTFGYWEFRNGSSIHQHCHPQGGGLGNSRRRSWSTIDGRAI